MRSVQFFGIRVYAMPITCHIGTFILLLSFWDSDHGEKYNVNESTAISWKYVGSTTNNLSSCSSYIENIAKGTMDPRVEFISQF